MFLMSYSVRGHSAKPVAASRSEKSICELSNIGHKEMWQPIAAPVSFRKSLGGHII